MEIWNIFVFYWHNWFGYTYNYIEERGWFIDMCKDCEYIMVCPVSEVHKRKSPSKRCAIDILEHLRNNHCVEAPPFDYGDRRDWGWE